MSTSGSQSGLVLELAEEFLGRYRRGERPSLKEYTDRHPALAGEIREVFPAMAMMEHIALADESLAGDAAGAPPSSPPRLERLGDFRILREVGRGGMGVVYEAEQVSLGRHVALKVLPAAMLRDDRRRPRFEREARAAARLHHTNIVPVFGVGEHDGTPYYVMQFIQGLGLDEVLAELKRLRHQSAAGAPGPPEAAEAAGPPSAPARRDVSAAAVARSLMTGRFEAAPVASGSEAIPATLAATATYTPPPTEDGPRPAPDGSGRSFDALSSSSVSLLGSGPRSGADGRPGPARRPDYWRGVARLGVQVAGALEYAHKQGVIHRDVKPSNLLLDTRGTVWVTDFGLAKASDQQDLTHTGDLLGTLRYMPPEAFEGRADHRGDIYALGLTLYELLAFRPAFGARDRARLVRQVTTAEAPRLGSLNPAVPRDLETVVHKAIDRDPAHRYGSAGELAADLQRFLDDEPIRARRQSQIERYRRWARRHPGIAVLGGVLTAVLVLVTIASLIVAGRMGRLADRSERAARAAELARRREAQQRAAAEAARHQAEANFARARRAVDDFFTQVSETRLLTAPGLQPLRLDLLRSALGFYEEFLKERGDDPALRAELLATRYRVGRILQEIGRGDEASREFEAARDGYRRVAREAPADPGWKEGLYQTLPRGDAETNEDRVTHFREAIALCEELARADPGERRYKKDLGDLYNNLANILSWADRRDEAVQAYRQSAELRLALAASHPDDPDTHASLAQTFNNIAILLKGSPAQQLPMLRRAVGFAEAAWRLRPQDYELGRGLGILYKNGADALWSLGRTDDALRVFKARADQQWTLARDNPAVPGAPAAALDALADYARKLKASGGTEEAVSTFLRSRELLKRLPRGDAGRLFEAAARHGWFVDTLKSLSEYGGKVPHDVDRLRVIQDTSADAMGLLGEAVDAGFRDHEKFRREPRLVPLRGLPGFSELAARVEVAAKAGPEPAAVGATGPTPGAALTTTAAAPPPSIRADRAMIYQALGRLLLDAGKLDEAGRALDEALALREGPPGVPADPAEEADLWLDLAELDRKTGRAERARDRLDRAQRVLARAAAASPDDPLLWKGLGTVHDRLGWTDETVVVLARAMARMPMPGGGAAGLWRWTDPTGVYQVAASDPDLFERVVRLRPDDPRLYRARITYLTDRRDWRQAADVIARLYQAMPNQWYVHIEAIVRAWTFDTDGYRRVCREMLARHGWETYPGVAHRVAQSCLLLPATLPDLHVLEPVLARRSFDPGEKLYEYSHWVQGLYNDRTGDPTEALDAYHSISAPGQGVPGPKLHAAKAIACHHAGRAAQARRELDEARRLLRVQNFDPEHEGSTPAEWHEALLTLVLLREAEALVLYDPIFPADPFAR